MGLHIRRVATDMNVADLPTRGEFNLLWHIGAVEMKPTLDNPYHEPEAWQALQERWAM